MTAKRKGKYKSNAGTFESEDLSVSYKRDHLNKEKSLKYVGWYLIDSFLQIPARNALYAMQYTFIGRTKM